jgi:hypothetical protein
MLSTYGKFTKEADGRMSGTVLNVTPRNDGKFKVSHCYGSGKVINKIYTREQLTEQINKL